VRSPSSSRLRLKRGQRRRARTRPRNGLSSGRTRSFRGPVPCGRAKRSSSRVAIPSAQGNRPELLRQTPVPASPPRALGPDHGYTDHRRHREGDRIPNIAGGSSILRREHDRTGERAHHGRAARDQARTPTSTARRRWKCRAPPSGCRRRRARESASGRTGDRWSRRRTDSACRRSALPRTSAHPRSSEGA
jgi:hypothetical protein